MHNMRKLFTLSLIVFISVLLLPETYAQKRFMVGDDYSHDPVNPESFNQKLFQEVLLYRLNSYLDSLSLEGFEGHDFFDNAARQHAEMMAQSGNANLEERGALKTVRDRLIAAGGTGIGSEVVARINARIANEYITYDELANQCLFRWMSSGRYSQYLLSQKFFFAGTYVKFDEQGRRAFISLYMGNYASLLQANHLFTELTMQPTTKSFGLKPYEDRYCQRALRRMPNYVDLQSGLSINESGEIIFKHNNLRAIRRFIKDNKDGLAVDIIQKNQFSDCSNPNIVDYTNNNLGVMTKRIWAKRIYKRNIAEGEGRRNRVTKLEVVLGHFPENLRKEDVELNLIIIKNKIVCANVPPSYVDASIYDYAQKVGILPDTIVPQGVPEYIPTATSTELKFRIPFEQGKFDYKKEDMIPVLEALNEPSFIIDKIFIAAYSSLEGTERENAVLQKRRAQSIVKAFEENQNSSIIDSIITAPNWEGLREDVKGTIYDHILELSYEEAVRYVNANVKKLERFLQFHRYADVTVWVTYDIEGDKEQAYVVDQFNKAIEAENLSYALSIQKYIFKQVIKGKYNSHAVSNMRIPQGKAYVGLNMNKIWLTQFVFMDPLNEDYFEQIAELHKLDDSNPFVEFNEILCNVQLNDLTNDRFVNVLQKRVDRMYNTNLNEKTVDLLNIELQYQIMDIYKDSLGYDHPKVISSLEKIKEILSFNEITWQNSLKLSGIFINNGDYEYAIRLLEPWINKEFVHIDLVRSYITVCSKVQYKVHSNNYYNALVKLKDHDKDEFCNLFKGDKLSIQTFINNRVKQLHCEVCK